MWFRPEQRTLPSMPSLATRLEQARLTPPSDTERLAHVVKQTDLLRGKAIPWMIDQGFSSRSLLTYIHRVHVLGNEGLVLAPETVVEVSETRSSLEVAGQVRPHGNDDPTDPSTKIFMEGLNCGTRSVAYALLNQLMDRVDFLFPAEGINQEVTRENVYTYLASVQYLLLLTHPFLEANGRVSEDFIYALMLRYDRSHPEEPSIVRNISSDGSRTGDETERVMELMYQASVGIGNRVIKDTFKPDVHLYEDLPIFWGFQTLILYSIRQFHADNERGATEVELEEIMRGIQKTYDAAYLKYISKLMDAFLASRTISADLESDTAVQQNLLFVQSLTQNLEAASPQYHFS